MFLQTGLPSPPAGYEEALVTFGRGAVAFLLVVAVGRAVLVPAVGRIIGARNPKNRTIQRATEQYLVGVVVAVALVVGVVVAGFGRLLSGSALVVAALTLALGVAGQEVIGNFVSGVFLVTDPDFNVDDWIAWQGGEGVVESISFRVTRVRTPNNEIIVVPNTTLATGQVTRPYGRDRFRITASFAVPFDADLDAVKAALREEAEAVDEVIDDPPPMARIVEFGDTGVQLRVQFWIREPERMGVARVRSAYLQRVTERLDAMDVAISPASQHALSGSLTVADERPSPPE